MAAEVWCVRAFCGGLALWRVRCEGGKNLVDWRRGILCPEGGNGGGDFLLEDFDESFVFLDALLIAIDFGDDFFLNVERGKGDFKR